MDLLKLAKYNKWAGDKTRDVLKNVSNEEYLLELGEPFTKNLNTLKKIINIPFEDLSLF